MASTHERRWWILGVLCLSVLLVSVDNTIVNVALPTMSRELSATTSQLQWVVDAYTLVFAGLLLLGGHLGDRFGRRRLLQIGIVAFAATSLVASFASSADQLIAGRAFMGVSAALIYPATLALLTTTFTDRRERAAAIGLWSGVTGLGVALGPVSGGLLLEHFSWGSVLWVNVPVALLALVAGLRLLPESKDDSPGRFDPVGGFGSIVGIGLLVWTTIEAPSNGWASRTTLLGYAGAAVALAAFVGWELRRPDPLLDMRLFRNPRFSAASGAIALAFFGLFGFIFLITQYFQVVRGYSTLRAGVATLPFAVVTGAISPLAILLMHRLGTKLVVTFGLLTMSSGFVVAATTGLETPYWGRVVVSMVLMATGLALSVSPATEAIMGALPVSQAGAGSAVNDTVREVGGTLGVAVVGSTLSTVYGPRIVDGLGALNVPPAAVAKASDSVVGGLHVAMSLPGSAATQAAQVVRQSFMDGLVAGSLVSAGACFVAAMAALIFLPARHAAPATDVVEDGVELVHA
ncbi:MAG: DHA2 family efflux MFS transporter permease subunit [Actinomycetales bacterium]